MKTTTTVTVGDTVTVDGQWQGVVRYVRGRWVGVSEYGQRVDEVQVERVRKS